MIKFKLCKQYNTVEIEYDNIESINIDDLENIYNMLPEYKSEEPIVEVLKPTEKQLDLAKRLGISTYKMSREDLKAAIADALDANYGKINK